MHSLSYSFALGPLRQEQTTLDHQRGRAFNKTSSSLLPRQAQEKMQHSSEFREAVLSFKGQSPCIIERAIELDYINKIQNKQYNKENNNNHDQLCTKGASGSQPLLPHQAQERMVHSPSFRKKVLSFGGQNDCLVERAIELDYITRVRSCLTKEN
mmetsp:Transcript_8413/g.9577  ORF Transcript_8413/g.9577 Transcript_8413/m.9577 type:complete len:155 (-) Transcript_8413:138-602(-)